eukprot:358513-Chlamydomonas_euryale.AAC.3
MGLMRRATTVGSLLACLLLGSTTAVSGACTNAQQWRITTGCKDRNRPQHWALARVANPEMADAML